LKVQSKSSPAGDNQSNHLPSHGPLPWHGIRNLISSTSYHKSDLLPDDINEEFRKVLQKDKGPCEPPHYGTEQKISDLVLLEHEVERELSQTKNSSPGIDEIPAWILREFSPILAAAVTHVFNSSLSSCLYPECFKFATVTPIPKTRSPTLSDFRPISLLPLLSKVFERIILKKWFIPLTLDKMDPMQFAFTRGPGKGCSCALALIQHKILNFLDESSGAVRLLLVDLSKAFDCATKSVTIQALTRLCIPPELIYWTHSYMKGRHQSVKYNGKSSQWMKISSGVPQGSVLGPFLFATIIDNLCPLMPNSVLIKFADDITVIHFIRSPLDDKLDAEWSHIKEWCASAQLRPNPNKTKILNIVTSKKLTTFCDVLELGVPIETVRFVRLLGVIFSDDLSWDRHVEDVISRASRRLFSIVLLRSTEVPPRMLWNFYCAVIRSILLYAYPAWCNCNGGLWDRLSKVERRAVKIIGHLEGITTIRQAADNLCTQLVRKIVKNEGHPLSELIVWREPRGTRDNRIATSCWAKTTRFQKSLTSYADKL
jgi:hypothetical protein